MDYLKTARAHLDVALANIEDDPAREEEFAAGGIAVTLWDLGEDRACEIFAEDGFPTDFNREGIRFALGVLDRYEAKRA
ncbi:MAG: hypothetical protein OXN81_07395 [Alphaproteobacteria bacterium]|nr:hypothetical protein [Alphaproteobacteria bacterium]